MYTLTHDPLFLGLIGLAEAVPALSLALFSGYIVDRGNPVIILRSVVALWIFSAALLVGSHLPGMQLDTQIQIIALFCSSFLTGIARSFLHPTIYRIIPELMPRTQLSKASAWMTTSFQVGSVSGPAIGGLIFGWAGIFYASATIMALLTLAMVLALWFEFKPTPSTHKPAPQSLKEEILSGAKFVFKHKIMLPALTLDMVSVLFGGVTALLPIYAAEILIVGPLGLGFLRAAPALGASSVSFWLTRTEIKKNAGRLLLGCVAGFGLCLLVFSLSKNYTLSLIVLALSGAFDSVSAVIRGTIVQLCSPDDLRGRISAVNMIFISSSNELGEFESGIAAKLLGVVPAAVFGSIVCLLTVGTVSFFCPKLRQLNLGDLIETPEK